MNPERPLDILKSAAAAFRRHGYHGSSVGKIADALGMTKGSLYYHFKDKEAILLACHTYSLDALLALLADVEDSSAPPDVKLERLVAGFVHTILDELHGTALFLDLDALGRRNLRQVVKRRDQFDRGMRRVIRDGIRQGVFAPVDPKLVSFAILGAVNWIPRWFKPTGRAHSDEIIRTYSSFFIQGLRSRSKAPRTVDRGRRRRHQKERPRRRVAKPGVP